MLFLAKDSVTSANEDVNGSFMIKSTDILDEICLRTDEFIQMMPKKLRKNYGQFFTGIKTARFMASIFTFPQDKETISILDAGAGSGILAAALLERLIDNTKAKISVTCYETDPNIVPLAWDTEVWIAELPDHMIHLNGDKFLGPR